MPPEPPEPGEGELPPHEPSGEEVADLDISPDAPGEVSGPIALESAPYDPTRDREEKRGQVAMILLWLLFIVIVTPFVLIALRWSCFSIFGAESCSTFPDIDVLALLEKVLTPLVGLVGAVTGFYFGERKG
ncbi:MAG: hypothetical protein D6754_03655 [Alphaproteobacteria bacterium]|nr:MAG: hypothetical protein D6754_03655 [Alphaproteobacteria bacterium]